MARNPLQLVVTIHDRRTGSVMEKVLTRFPVSIGRGDANSIDLPAKTVSRHHGVFIHKDGSLLQYVDLGSRHGTAIEGILIEPTELVPLRDSDVITIAPYAITFHLRQGRPRPHRGVTAPISLTVGPPAVTLWKETLAGSAAIRRLRAEHSPSDLLRRAAEALELIAEMIVLFRRPSAGEPSVLRSSRAPDQIVAHLLSPSTGVRALRELRDVLTELISNPLTPGALK
jgi:hypothetical protein